MLVTQNHFLTMCAKCCSSTPSLTNLNNGNKNQTETEKSK